jgi:peptidoglycan/LPS O-acetylase OafA/YrhL
MHESTKHAHYYALDIIRIIAAMLVVLFHFANFKDDFTGDFVFPALRGFHGFGSVGVEIFFVISGFVIAMSAEAARGLKGALRFMHLRALRILPALWISSLIGFSALLLAGEALPDLTMRLVKSSMLSPVGPYIDGVVWSLVVEAVFYLCVGVAIISGSRMQLETLAKVICIASTVFLSLWASAFFFSEPFQDFLSRFIFRILLFRHGVFFALGMLLWARTRGNRSASVAGFLLLSGAMCIVEICFSRDLWPGISTAAAGVWLASIATMMFCVKHATSIEAYLSIRQRKIVRYLGTFSYALYLNHYTFGDFVVRSFSKVSLSSSAFATILLFISSMASVLLISALVTFSERIIKTRFRLQPAARLKPT